MQTKNLGIWLDHTKAYLMEPQGSNTKIETILSEYTGLERVEGESPTGIRLGNYRSSNDEYSRHTRKEELLREYYRILSDRIINYENVILFGPATAKKELYNQLIANKKFNKVHMRVAPKDKMTEKQMTSFVRKYFTKK